MGLGFDMGLGGNLAELNYAPFSRSDRIGKAADWTNLNAINRIQRTNNTAVSTAFNVFGEEDEEDYSLVDTRVQKAKVVYGRKPFTKVPPKVKIQQKNKLPQNMQQMHQKPRMAKNRKGPTNRYQNQQWVNYGQRTGRKFMPTIELEWGDPALVLEFSTLLGTTKIPAPAGETLRSCGHVERYNDAYDKLSIRQEKPLEKTDRKKYTVSTSNDPILGQLMKENAGNVYATDSIIATLMCATKSVYSWDILVKKEGDTIIFDRRDEPTFDYLTVNENASEPPNDEDLSSPCNVSDELHKESTYLNLAFSQQLLVKDEHKALKFATPNPFHTGPESTVASGAYLYRKWNLGDDIQLVARTEIDAVKYNKNSNKPSFVVIKALNEYDTKITGNWRNKLESQRAGCFATEAKNNNNKLSKWAVLASLSSAEELKLGYVSRSNPRDQFNHVILNVSTQTPNDFAREIGVDLGKMWANFKLLVTELRKLDDGEYFILREGNKKHLIVHYKTE